MKNVKLFEEFSIDNEIISFLNKQMLDDKKEYKGDIPTKYNTGSKWNDSSWIVTEIMQFLNKDYTTSYILINFSKKYNYDILNNILKRNFKKEYEKSKELLEE